MRISKIILSIAIILFLTNYVVLKKNVIIFLAGDSTMTEKLIDKRPETGWGEKFGMFFKSNIEIKNHAKNGRSTKTLISEGRWQTIVQNVAQGDYVFIQFGHNDQSKKRWIDIHLQGTSKLI